MHRSVLVLAPLLLGVTASGAQATVISYSTAAAFDAATTGLTSYSIPSPASCCSQHVEPSIAIGPITFGASNLILFDDGGYGVGQNYLDGDTSDLTGSLSGATALSFQLGTYYGADSVDISVNGVFVTTVTESAGHPSSLFIGFTDTVPITDVTFHNQSNDGTIFSEIDVLNFAVGRSTVVDSLSVPEPGSLAIISAGLLGLAGLRRRRKANPI